MRWRVGFQSATPLADHAVEVVTFPHRLVPEVAFGPVERSRTAPTLRLFATSMLAAKPGNVRKKLSAGINSDPSWIEFSFPFQRMILNNKFALVCAAPRRQARRQPTRDAIARMPRQAGRFTAPLAGNTVGCLINGSGVTGLRPAACAAQGRSAQSLQRRWLWIGRSSWSPISTIRRIAEVCRK